jgi:hypothetical protein
VLSGIRGVRGQLAEQFELDMGGRQVAEQSSALPEQDRYDVQFHFVELPGPQQRLCCSGPIDHHVAVPGGRAGLRGALEYVGDVADAARRRVAGDGVGEDEDRYAAVVVALPPAGVFVGTPAGDDSAGGNQLGEHLIIRSGVVGPPVEQPEPADAHRRATLSRSPAI